VASTSPRETSHGADGGVFRVRQVVFAPRRGVRATGGRHAKSALKYLYAKKPHAWVHGAVVTLYLMRLAPLLHSDQHGMGAVAEQRVPMVCGSI
jgi:hypothetical protein